MEPGESRPSICSAEESPTIRVLFRRGVPNPLTTADRRFLKRFAQKLAQQLAGGRAFHCLLSDDTKLRQLNCQFLGHDYTTDVLSFPATDPSSVGDLAISVERAQAQAHDLGHSLRDEVQVLTLHGLLHLVGYDHEQDSGEMAREEQRWRKHFGLPQTLIERNESRPGVRR